jgi:glycosyltransferase involved in cell wall biosynthesis
MPERSLKIALVTDWYPPAVGGVEVQVQGLARALACRGHDVRVLTTSRGEDPDDVARVDRLPVPHLPGTRIAVPARSPYRALRERIEADRPDVVHAHGMFSTLAMGGLIAARALDVPSVVTHHSLIRPALLPWARLIYLFASGRADLVTAVSRAAALDAARASGRRDVLILPNGIDLPVDGPDGGRAGATPGIRVTSVMRLTRKKMPYHLVRDFARVLERVSDPRRLRLTIVGDGPERARVERLATTLGIRGRVEFSGSRTRAEVVRILADSTLFVSPSHAEAFGLVLLEARAAGLPSVAMAGGGAGEVVEDGRQGLLAHSRREFVEAIVRLIEDAPLRRRLADASRAGLERFSWDAVVAQHLDVYRLAMERHLRRRERTAA